MTLREQVEALLPNWQSWYPSVFDAAQDLGLIRAQVCSLSSLMLSHRHAAVQSQAMQAHRERWGGTEQPDENDARHAAGGSKARRRRRKKNHR